MQLKQVIFIILLLIKGLWAITHNDEGKQRRISATATTTTTTAARETKKLKNSEQPENLVKINESSDDEEKKTLSQQVADGKYGLIQKELFSEPVKRPGILSYEVNPEVPKDNVNNLGGLMPEEIWLAENHLLVLKGGNLDGEGKWPAIDNYVAPRRQVKIPQNPKIPPPFPVQLTDGGPTQFIRSKNNSGYPDNNTYPGNFNVGNGYAPPFPFLPPIHPPIPAFLPRPENATDLDEDDPRIYYPPPYDFIYPRDNSSFVPAGPIVPGIVVPPPPNFFSLLDKKSNNKVNTTRSRPIRPKQRIKTITTTKIPTTISTTTRIPTTISTTTKKPIKTITTTIKITTTYKTKPKLQTTTISPNDIVHTLPPNTPIGDWVPIPAPKPFYISLKPYGIEEQINQPGWKLYNKTNFYVKPNNIQYKTQNNDNFVNFDQTKYERNTEKTNLKYFNSPIDYYLQKFDNKNSKSTEKPPIYEYSYSAPGYGTIEAPKIGKHFYDITTRKPYNYNLYDQTTVTKQKPYNYNLYDQTAVTKQKPYDYNLYEQAVLLKQRPYDYNLYDQTAVRKQKPYDYNLYEQTAVTTKKPYDYNLYEQTAVTTQKPYDYNLYEQTAVPKQKPYDYDLYEQTAVSTQRPYDYNFYTNNNNNNKYFNSFGDKLNFDITTVLPDVKFRSSKSSEFRNLSGRRQRPLYESQNDQPFIENQYYPGRIYYRSTLKPYSRPSYDYDDPPIPHSLHSDINVNYKQPLPSINPHAEFINPYPPQKQSPLPQRTSSTLISYQLPGSTGHFYFLTPQAVK